MQICWRKTFHFFHVCAYMCLTCVYYIYCMYLVRVCYVFILHVYFMRVCPSCLFIWLQCLCVTILFAIFTSLFVRPWPVYLFDRIVYGYPACSITPTPPPLFQKNCLPQNIVLAIKIATRYLLLAHTQSHTPLHSIYFFFREYFYPIKLYSISLFCYAFTDIGISIGISNIVLVFRHVMVLVSLTFLWIRTYLYDLPIQCMYRYR